MTAGITSIASRPFAGDADLRLAAEFIRGLGGPRAGAWHIGDVWWKLYQNTELDPARDVRLWVDGATGALLALAWFEEHDGVDWQLHPRLAAAPARRDGVQDEILAWGASHPGRTVGEDGPELWAWALDRRDEERVAYLHARDFVRDTFHMIQMCRDLSEPIPEAPPPEGWRVRAVGGEEEWAERVAAHRDVWDPSRVTLPAYGRLRACAGYSPELDLVAEAPEGGTFGAYCLAWLDPATRSGEFEPVGTRAAFRRLGLGKAVVSEGLRRLRALGAREAFVYGVHDSEPANRLYESTGFRPFNRAYLYGKKL